ncbi:MAG: anti-sigma factor RsbA family regulatory protein [Frankia sp.]
MPDAMPGAGGSLHHEALFYGTAAEYVEGIGDFIRAGLAAGEPVCVAVPLARRHLLWERIPTDAARVRFVDMDVVGRNPSRIIPTISAFVNAHPDRRVRFIGEPIWNGRSPAETIEATRHEALLNLSFADMAIRILCPYDTVGLSPAILADAERNHPILHAHEHRTRSTPYADPRVVHAAVDRPLAERPPDARSLAFGRDDLSAVLSFVWHGAHGAGMASGRIRDLLSAVSELIMNTIAHAGGYGTVATWPERDGTGLVCEVRDAGHIADPLVGRVAPRPGSVQSERGLWLVNQVCDLVEVRSSRAGTIVRLHLWDQPAPHEGATIRPTEQDARSDALG